MFSDRPMSFVSLVFFLVVGPVCSSLRVGQVSNHPRASGLHHVLPGPGFVVLAACSQDISVSAASSTRFVHLDRIRTAADILGSAESVFHSHVLLHGL